MTPRTTRAWLAALGLGAALASLSGVAHGADDTSCSDSLFADVGEHLGLATFAMQSQHGGTIVAADCKQAPDNPKLTLAVIAYDQSVEYQKMLFIGLVDEEGGKVVSSLSSVFEEDALTEIGYKSLRLDTARYKLAPGVRAFGFDLTSRSRHYCPDGGFGPTRYLYVREGKKIRQIMADFAVSGWSYLGEDASACGKIEAPARPVEYVDRSLTVAASRTKGFADLLVTSTTRADGKKGVVRTSRIVRYDGDSYPVNQGGDF